jgi:hypothetical protein
MTQIASKAPQPQRMRALERANSVRLARAELKRRIADGETSAAAIIIGCPGEVRRWTVSELLLSQRRWGATRCRKFLESVEISEIKLIGDLTDRQRKLLATALGGCAEPVTQIDRDIDPSIDDGPDAVSDAGRRAVGAARELTYA